jgi:hypothetical protein
MGAMIRRAERAAARDVRDLGWRRHLALRQGEQIEELTAIGEGRELRLQVYVVRRVALAGIAKIPVAEGSQKGIEFCNGRTEARQVGFRHFHVELRPVRGNGARKRSQHNLLHPFDIDLNEIRPLESEGADQGLRIDVAALRDRILCIEASAGVTLDLDPPQPRLRTVSDDGADGLNSAGEAIHRHVPIENVAVPRTGLDSQHLAAGSGLLCEGNSKAPNMGANVDADIALSDLVQHHGHLVAGVGAVRQELAGDEVARQAIKHAVHRVERNQLVQPWIVGHGESRRDG